MSAKVMGQVWDYELAPDEQAILLAFADHADHEGREAYPSVGLVAWKTGYSERTVQRVLSSMRTRGVLVVTKKKGQHRPVTYRIALNSLKLKNPYLRGDNVTPLKSVPEVTGENPEVTGWAPEVTQPSHLNRPSNHPEEPSSRARADKSAGPGTGGLRQLTPVAFLRCKCGETIHEHRPNGSCTRDRCSCRFFVVKATG